MSHGFGWWNDRYEHSLAAGGVKVRSRPFKGSIPQYEPTLVAGRGEIGSMNWGCGEPSEKDLARWENNLKPLIGKTVMLSGGGGSGAHFGTLRKVWIEERGPGERGLRVRLTGLYPDFHFGRPRKEQVFEPYIGSWQISALKKIGYVSKRSAAKDGQVFF